MVTRYDDVKDACRQFNALYLLKNKDTTLLSQIGQRFGHSTKEIYELFYFLNDCCFIDDLKEFLENSPLPLSRDVLSALDPNHYPPAAPPTFHPSSQPQTYPPSYPQTYPPNQPQTYPPNQPQTYPPNQPQTYPPNQPQTYPPNQPQTYPPSYPQTYPPSQPQTYPPNQPQTYPPSYPQTYPPSQPQTYPPSYPNTYPSSYTQTQPPIDDYQADKMDVVSAPPNLSLIANIRLLHPNECQMSTDIKNYGIELTKHCPSFQNRFWETPARNVAKQITQYDAIINSLGDEIEKALVGSKDAVFITLIGYTPIYKNDKNESTPRIGTILIPDNDGSYIVYPIVQILEKLADSKYHNLPKYLFLFTQPPPIHIGKRLRYYVIETVDIPRVESIDNVGFDFEKKYHASLNYRNNCRKNTSFYQIHSNNYSCNVINCFTNYEYHFETLKTERWENEMTESCFNIADQLFTCKSVQRMFTQYDPKTNSTNHMNGFSPLHGESFAHILMLDDTKVPLYEMEVESPRVIAAISCFLHTGRNWTVDKDHYDLRNLDLTNSPLVNLRGDLEGKDSKDTCYLFILHRSQPWQYDPIDIYKNIITQIVKLIGNPNIAKLFFIFNQFHPNSDENNLKNYVDQQFKNESLFILWPNPPTYFPNFFGILSKYPHYSALEDIIDQTNTSKGVQLDKIYRPCMINNLTGRNSGIFYFNPFVDDPSRPVLWKDEFDEYEAKRKK